VSQRATQPLPTSNIWPWNLGTQRHRPSPEVRPISQLQCAPGFDGCAPPLGIMLHAHALPCPFIRKGPGHGCDPDSAVAQEGTKMPPRNDSNDSMLMILP
jgi:hypothetical protein